MKTLLLNFYEGDMQYFLKMFRFVKPYAVRYAVTQILYSAQGFAVPFIFAIFTGNIMAAILVSDKEKIVSAGIVLAVMMLSYILVLAIAVYGNMLVIERAIMDLKKRLFRVFMRTGLENASHSGEGIASINTDADTASKVYSDVLMPVMSNIISITGASVAIFIMDWRLGLASLIIGSLSFIMQNRYTRPLASIGSEQLRVNAEATKAASNSFSGAITIRSFNMQSQAYISFDRENNRLKTLDVRQGLIRVGQNIFSTIEGWMTMVAVFGLGGWLAATGRMEFHVIAPIYVLSSTLTSAIGSLGKNYAGLQPSIAGAKRVFEVLESERAIPARISSNKKPSGYRLSIKNLNFKYLNSEAETLKDINLEIGENEMIAIVGESGSGKSTLLRVIIGMYVREDLNISYGGVKFHECSLNGWRKNFAYVDQSCKLFDMSILENIKMGADENVSHDDIISAAKRAMAHDFITEQESGYDNSCGEKGGSLSGGQKQRIAIARALVKKSPFLVFDEATSALDKESEQHIMQTINTLKNDHTTLFTTHNLQNAVVADKIVVMDKGMITEMGTHAELIEKDGLYCRLFNSAQVS